tara:strand:+ start:3260 stop:3877 length:618 start_codon:yes stop_codon:yes gene_type:complete
MKIGIINLNINNLSSIYNSLSKCNYKVKIITNNEKKFNYDLVVLPGVGSFKSAMHYIKKNHIDEKILEYLSKNNARLYGICLGMQLLFEKSNEFGNCEGLKIIKGKVKKIPQNKAKMSNNIGWNKILFNNKIHTKSNQLKGNYFYFVHSYYCDPLNHNNIFSLSNLNNFTFCSSIIDNKIFATQFHPEKSGLSGKKFIKSLKYFF